MGSYYYYEESLYVVLSVFAVTTNKYVLSTLHFTVPTVFQGWQTLVCLILLTIIMRWTKFRLEIEKLDRQTYLRLAVPALAFSLSSVAGSKALASLPVAVFVSGTNLIPAGLALIEPETTKTLSSPSVSGSCVLILTMLLLFSLSRDVYNIGWFWLLTHSTAGIIYSVTIRPLRLQSTTCIYHCNLLSLLILMPLSFYLQEVNSALSHAKNAKLEFYVGCFLSGVLGTGVQVLSGRLGAKNNLLGFFNGLAKISSCTVSLLCFPNYLNPLAWLVAVFNLVLGSCIFVPEKGIQKSGQLCDI